MTVSVTDEYGNTSVRAVAVQIVPRAPRAPVRAVHVTFYAWAGPGAAPRRHAADRPAPHQHGRDRPQGRVRDRRLRRDHPARADRSAPYRTSTTCAGDPHAPQQGRHGRRPDRRLPRPDLRDRPPGSAAGSRRSSRPLAASLTRATAGSRTSRARPSAVQHRDRRGGGEGRNRRRPLRLRAPAGRADLDDGVPGADGHPGAVDRRRFLGEARQALKPYGTFLGASVFGVAATRPTEVAQNIRADRAQRRLRRADGLPVALGERRVQRLVPERRAVRDRPAVADGLQQAGARAPARASCRGSRTSRSASTYGPAQVARRSRPRSDDGIDEWLLWDPLVTYTNGGLPKAPARAAARLEAGDGAAVGGDRPSAAARGSGSHAERARRGAGDDVPPDPRRRRRRLRPDAEAVPRGAGAALARGLLAGARRRSGRRASSTSRRARRPSS